jgi:hypothetical protein
MRILADQVVRPPADLGGDAGRGRIDGRADQHQAGNQVRPAHSELDGDLSAERVPEQVRGAGCAGTTREPSPPS